MTTWLQGKGTDFWHVECSNIIQDRSTAVSALSVKQIETRHNGITGNKMAGQIHNEPEIIHTFLVAKKREPENLGWHL